MISDGMTVESVVVYLNQKIIKQEIQLNELMLNYQFTLEEFAKLKIELEQLKGVRNEQGDTNRGS